MPESKKLKTKTSKPSRRACHLETPHTHERARLGSDFSERTFEHHAALLGDSRMSQPMYTSMRAAIALRLQRDYGNRYVQRLVNHISRKRAEAEIQRRVVWTDGDRTNNVDLVNTVTAFRDFGVTPNLINGQEFPGGGDAKTVITPPVFTFTPNGDGKTLLNVLSEPVNYVGYRMELPAAPPWQKTVANDLAASAIETVAWPRHFAKELAPYKANSGDTTLLKVRGMPSDAKFAELVETHEDHHVEETHEAIEAILEPWDNNLREVHDLLPIVAETPQKAQEGYYKMVGGTPEEIGEKFVDDLKVRGEAFHETHEGGPPSIAKVRTKKDRSELSVYWKHPMD